MKPREKRHRVLIQARMRAESGWGEVLIQNVSSRGMLLRAAAPPRTGSYVEIRKATMTIVARAVWVRDQYFGVRTQDVIDLQGLLDEAADSLSREMGLTPAKGDRRRAPRSDRPNPAQTAERNRQRAAFGQFAVIAALAALAALLIGGAISEVMSKPFGAIESALAGSPESQS